MLRHIFVGPTFPGCTDERLSGVVDTLHAIPDIVPWIRKLSVEKTLGWCESQAVVLIAEFDSRADRERYIQEPAHMALGERIKDEHLTAGAYSRIMVQAHSAPAGR